MAGQKEKDESSLFDGVDVSLTSIAQYAGANPPAGLTSGLAAILTEGRRAQAAFASGNDAATAAPAEAGLAALRALRGQLGGMGLSEGARYEIDFRLKQKERDYENAVLASHNLTFDAVADDGLVVGGQAVRLSLSAGNRGATEVSVTRVEIAGFDSPGACTPAAVKKDASFTCSVEARVPKDAKATTPYFHDNYWKHPEEHAIQIFDQGVPFGVPFAPTPFRVTFHIQAGSVEVSREVPVQFRYIKDVFAGDKRMELNVVPALSVRVTPGLVVVPTAGGAVERTISVSVTSGAKSAAQATVRLELPAGWSATPASAALSFAHEDESVSARFRVTAPAQPKAGEYTLKAVATGADGTRFASGYQEIEYPHVERRQIMKPAEAALKVVDVKTTPGLNVGYVVGVGDQVAAAIEQLGAKVSYIDGDELERGDLSKYDVIVTGVRAYERRADLRAYNRRLIEYAERGGTLIVQYNKTGFNRTDFAPFPAQVSGNRVSDEDVPVKVLVPGHPAFNFPNKIGPEAWAKWVQERGLYFLGEKDAKYVDLVSMTDSYKDNPGEKLGSLVEGRVGKGRWLYVGLGAMAAASGGHGRGVSVDGEFAESGEGAGYTVNPGRLEGMPLAIQADDVRAAAGRILPLARKTPVMTSAGFDAEAGTRVFFKCENLQRGGAFKIRGAANLVLSLSRESLARGVVAYSSGNHAQATAIARQICRRAVDDCDAGGCAAVQNGSHAGLRSARHHVQPVYGQPRSYRAEHPERDGSYAGAAFRSPHDHGGAGHRGDGTVGGDRAVGRLDHSGGRRRAALGLRYDRQGAATFDSRLRRGARRGERHLSFDAGRGADLRASRHDRRRSARAEARRIDVSGDAATGGAHRAGKRGRDSRCHQIRTAASQDSGRAQRRGVGGGGVVPEITPRDPVRGRGDLRRQRGFPRSRQDVRCAAILSTRMSCFSPSARVG